MLESKSNLILSNKIFPTSLPLLCVKINKVNIFKIINSIKLSRLFIFGLIRKYNKRLSLQSEYILYIRKTLCLLLAKKSKFDINILIKINPESIPHFFIK